MSNANAVDPLQLLCEKYGPMMNSRDVQTALRYRTLGGFRAARHLGTINLEMFRIPGRRGLFAKTEDVAFLMRRMLSPPDQLTEEAAM